MVSRQPPLIDEILIKDKNSKQESRNLESQQKGMNINIFLDTKNTMTPQKNEGYFDEADIKNFKEINDK